MQLKQASLILFYLKQTFNTNKLYKRKNKNQIIFYYKDLIRSVMKNVQIMVGVILIKYVNVQKDIWDNIAKLLYVIHNA